MGNERRAIADKDVDAFCRDYIELYTAGATMAEMIPKLKKYWSQGPKLEEPVQVSNMARGLVDGARAPDFYIKWWEGARLKVVRPRGRAPSSGGLRPALAAAKVRTNTAPTNGAAHAHSNGAAAKPRTNTKLGDPSAEVFAALDVLREHGAITAGDAWTKFAEWKGKQG